MADPFAPVPTGLAPPPTKAPAKKAQAPVPSRARAQADAAKKRMQEKAKPAPSAHMPDWLTQPSVPLDAPPKPPPKPITGARAGMVKYSEKHKGATFDAGGLLGDAASQAATIVANKALRGWQMTPIGKGMQLAGKVAEQAPRLRPSPPSVPHVLVPNDWLDATSQAAAKGAPVYADEIKPGSYALGAAGRTKLMPLIKAKGYPIQDMPTWNDANAIARAYGPKYTYTPTDFLRNLAADAGEQGALVNLPRMLGESAAQSIHERSAMPLAHLGQNLLEGLRKPAPWIGDRPWTENWYERPLTTFLTVAPVIKGGLRIGPGRFLSPTREVTPPSALRAAEATGEPAVPQTIRASQHPIHRTGEAIHDYFLRHGNPDTAGMGPIQTGRAKLGNKIDEALQARTLHQTHEVARLKKGADPHIAILEYNKALQDVPRGTPIKGKKQARLIEAIVRGHVAFASHSDQTAAAFESFAKTSDAAAAEHEITAMHAQAELEAMRASPTTDARALARKEAEAKAALQDAQHARTIAKQQRDQAATAREFTIDPLNPEKGHGELAAKARNAARLQTQALRDAGFIDDKGVLYGDWQHRMTIVHATEGAGMSHANPDGSATTGWHIADAILNRETGLRDKFNILRNQIHGQAAGNDTEIPASADIRSPEAQHQFGRARRANRLIQALSGSMHELNRRQGERTARLPPEYAANPHGPIVHAIRRAADAAIAPHVVTNAVDKAVNALQATRKAGSDRARRIHDSASQLETQERTTHQENAQDTISRLEQQLRTATLAHAPQTKVIELHRMLEEARTAQSEGFKPSETLLTRRSRAEREAFLARMRELTPKQINEHIDKHFTPEEIQAIGRPVIEDAIRHGLDARTGYGPLMEDIGASQRESGAAFKAASGHNVEDALALDTLKARYGHALRSFAANQQALGHDAAHGRLHAPDETFGLQPTRVTGGEQFREGNFTGDMHVFFASDLAGLTHKAVEGLMYKELASGPFVLPHPIQGEPVPAGFHAIERAAWDNLERASRNGEQLDTLAKTLGQGGPSHVPFDGGETVLISDVMRQHVIDLIERGKPQELNAFLRATNTYRRWMLFTLPRTWVANAVGNPILASLQGAALKTWSESVWTLRHHPERIPNTLRLRGIAGNLNGKRGARGQFGPQAFWRHQNTFQEDNGNLMVYLFHAKKAFKSENNLHWFNRVGRMNEHWGAFLEKAARGENPDAALWSAKSAEMFGEMNKSFKYDKHLSGAIMFHRWVGHMIFLTAWTMPVRYPGRTLFLQQTAILADQYRKEHGLFPEWAHEMVPLWSEVDTVLGGQLQNVTWAFVGSNVNPLATYGQTFDLGDESRAKTPLQSAVANNINPLARIPIETLWLQRRLDTLQPFQDQFGNDINQIDPRVVANSVIANIPLVNTVFQRPGLADNTVQIPGLFPQNERFSKASLTDSSLAPSRAFRDRTWWQEVLLRIGSASGVTLRPIDAAGPRTQGTAMRTIDYAAQQQSQRASKDALAMLAKIRAMSPAEQRAWYRKNEPKLYDRKFPNG